MQELMLLVVFLLLMDWQAVFHLAVQSERAADSRPQRWIGRRRANAQIATERRLHCLHAPKSHDQFCLLGRVSQKRPTKNRA